MPVFEDLFDVCLEGDEFGGSDAEQIVVAASSLVKVDLSDSTLRRLQVTDCRFDDCNLANLDAPEAAFLRSTFSRCKFSGLQAHKTTFADVTFEDSRLDFASFGSAKFKRVTFTKCHMREADFSGVAFDTVRFVECDLTRTVFERMHVQRSEMSNCVLSGIRGLSELRGIAMETEDIAANAELFALELGIAALSRERRLLH